MLTAAIKTIDLTRVFKREKSELITALDKINIGVDEGEIFGLLGPNGASALLVDVDIDEVIKELVNKGISVLSLKRAVPTLEDVFLTKVGVGLVE